LNRNLHLLDNSIIDDKSFIVPNLVKSQTGSYYYYGGILPNQYNEFVRVYEQTDLSGVGDLPTDYRMRKLHLNQLPWKNNKLATTECGGESSIMKGMGIRRGTVDHQITSTSSMALKLKNRKYSVANCTPNS
jgi:hypothetical protein